MQVARLSAIAEQFLTRRKLLGASKHTLRVQGNLIRFFLSLHEDVESGALEFLSRYSNPSTFNLTLTYLGQFFDLLVDLEEIRVNPYKGIKRRRVSPRKVRLSVDVIRALLGAPDRTTYAGQRDYSLLLLTLDTGVRPGEALSLSLEDVDLEEMEVRVKREVAKDREERRLPISLPTGQALSLLIGVRPFEWRDAPLFCSYEGDKLDETSWARRMARYSKKIGAKIRPYDLRHAFALLSLQNGSDPWSLQTTLGHSSMSMTRRYLNLLQEDLHRNHQRSSPVLALLPTPKKRVVSLRR